MGTSRNVQWSQLFVSARKAIIRQWCEHSLSIGSGLPFLTVCRVEELQSPRALVKRFQLGAHQYCNPSKVRLSTSVRKNHIFCL